MKNNVVWSSSAIALFLLAANDASAQCRTVLVPNEHETWDHAGAVLDVDDDRLIMAAPAGNGEGSSDGVAYVFERGPGGWVQTGRLTAPEVGYLDGFSNAVGISGDVAVAGTTHYDDPIPGAGGVWVFEWDGASWERTQRLRPTGWTGAPNLGRSLAVDAGRIVAGAPGLAPAGGVYVFENGGNGWVDTHLLVPAPGDGTALGHAVAISGDTIVSPTDLELVVVFEFDGASWQRTHAIAPSSIPASLIFGRSLALDGDTLVVGAWTTSPLPGNAVVFQRALGNWHQRAVLGLYPSEGNHEFGAAVAVDGTRILVGAPGYLQAGAIDPGAAFLFELRGNQWKPSYRILADPYTDADELGAAVGLSGGDLLIGAPYDDVPTTDAGTIAVISMPASSQAFCFGNLAPCGNAAIYAGCRNSTGEGGLLVPCGTDSRAADDLTLHASDLAPGQPALLFTGDADIELLFGDGRLCTGGTQKRLDIVTADGAGDASYGPGLAAGASFDVGDEPRLQVWYRDPQGPCGSGFNLTNAVALSYGP